MYLHITNSRMTNTCNTCNWPVWFIIISVTLHPDTGEIKLPGLFNQTA